MDTVLHKKQIYKFGLYGFLKNLKFFEPFFIVFLKQSGLTFLQIGLLYSIREIIIYIFEVPSGVIADRYGKKTELVICFVFYILSFIVFFLGTDYYMFIFAMVLFGLGEAFRSGTHKAMIMTYLDKNEMKDSKSKIYGKTRSYSLIGSTVSSLVGIGLYFYFSNIAWLFLIAIIPYILDMILIISYPKYLNEKQDVSFKFKDFIQENINSVKYVFQNKNLLKLLISSSSYGAGFKSVKDYIQPLIVSITLSVVIFTNLSADDNTIIYIGVIYAAIYLLSSFASLNAHKISKRFSSDKVISIMWLLSGISFFILSAYINNLFVLVFVFLSRYLFLNIRKPLIIEKIGDLTIDSKRASALSIESQFTSLLLAIFAPILGYIADVYSIGMMLFLVGVTMIIIYLLKVFLIDMPFRVKN